MSGGNGNIDASLAALLGTAVSSSVTSTSTTPSTDGNNTTGSVTAPTSAVTNNEQSQSSSGGGDGVAQESEAGEIPGDGKNGTRDGSRGRSAERSNDGKGGNKGGQDSSRDRGGPRVGGARSSRGRELGEGRMECRILVDNMQVGGIIGRGGSNVKRIRNDCGVFVSVLTVGEQWSRQVKVRVITVEGTPDQISKALEIMADICIKAGLVTPAQCFSFCLVA
jgi:predicted RNA-binding protein YlqC (UPF0109 family)